MPPAHAISTADCLDNDLMTRVKQGDMAAFEVLVDKYKQPVLNFVSRILGDEKEAEDLAQVVFIQVFRSAHRYQGSAKFISWLFTIARNLCLNEIRRRARHPADPLEPRPIGGEESAGLQFEDHRSETPLNSVLLGELTGQVECALADLPEAQRTAILLICHDEMSYEEIAQVLGISLAATRSLIHRARERLKHRLRRYLHTSVATDSN